VSGLLVARPDNAGDVLLAGPAVRAAAASGRFVQFLCGPRGHAAARLLPGVDEVIGHRLPWIEPDPMPVRRGDADQLVADIRDRKITEAAVLTSSHQSPLPLAMLLRWAGVERIAAVSYDHAGSLLDHRITGDPDVHEVVRSLLVTDALGLARPDDDRLSVEIGDAALPAPLARGRPYVVVHPGASVPARTLPPPTWRAAVTELVRDGWAVAVTGSRQDAGLTATVCGNQLAVVDLAGRTRMAQLARVLASATAVATGNTGPMHLAAAVGAPVVAAFPPTVPLERWRPWRVPHVVLGDQHVACAGCRSHACPLPSPLCTDAVTGREVANAVARLAGIGAPAPTVAEAPTERVVTP
jgi:ADP-heptose:LPS heptosyltransferase